MRSALLFLAIAPLPGGDDRQAIPACPTGFPAVESAIESTLSSMAGDDELSILRALGVRDQELQAAMIEALPACTDEEDRAALIAAFAEINKEITEAGAAIVERTGWPDPEREPDLFVAAFLVVQHHDDLHFRKKMLGELRTLYENGAPVGEQLALLTDALATSDGEGQIYGTQGRCVDETWVADPIVNPAELDKRRQALGLLPHQRYASRTEAFLCEGA